MNLKTYLESIYRKNRKIFRAIEIKQNKDEEQIIIFSYKKDISVEEVMILHNICNSNNEK